MPAELGFGTLIPSSIPIAMRHTDSICDSDNGQTNENSSFIFWLLRFGLCVYVCVGVAEAEAGK